MSLRCTSRLRVATSSQSPSSFTRERSRFDPRCAHLFSARPGRGLAPHLVLRSGDTTWPVVTQPRRATGVQARRERRTCVVHAL
jgi:hypothetical protein